MRHRYVERPPVPALADLVSAVFVQQVPPGGAAVRHRHVPNGSTELTCRIGAAPAVLGPLTRPRTQLLAAGTTVVGLRLRPGAAPALLGVPAAQFAGLDLGAGAFWGGAADMIGDLVAAAPSPQQALAVLEAQVLARRGAGSRPDPLVAAAVARLMPGRAGSVLEVTSALHVSERSLRRRCLAAVGVAPKTLHRQLRFQGVLAVAQRAIALGRPPAEGGLARLAADTGYADHPHLDRECRRLTGESARVFLLETAAQCKHGHDHAASYGTPWPAEPPSRRRRGLH
jgi:AraC-like DNA-binding protein